MAGPNVPVWLIPTVRTDGSNVSDELTRFSRKETFRHPFDRDYGIICHSSKFRRLTGKTQVFVHPKNDYPRTRLTHSIEVAQLGRELAAIFRRAFEERFSQFFLGDAGTFERLVETACLAHDLGHPPFGHAGAKVLEELCAAEGCAFDDNKHTVRYFLGIGHDERLPVTNVLLDAVLKYKPLGDAWYIEDGARCRSLIDSLGTQDHRHPATYLMEIADDLVNFTSDLEDAVHLGVLDEPQRNHFFKSVDVPFDPMANAKSDSSNLLKILIREHVAPAIERALEALPLDLGERAENFPRLFQDHVRAQADRVYDGPEKKREAHGLNLLTTIAISKKTLTTTFKDLYHHPDFGILRDPKLKRPEQYAKEILREIWKKLLELSESTNLGSYEGKMAYLALPDTLQQLFRAHFKGGNDRKTLFTELAHYLAGMTEKYCVSLHKKLMKPSTELFEEAIEI